MRVLKTRTTDLERRKEKFLPSGMKKDSIHQNFRLRRRIKEEVAEYRRRGEKGEARPKRLDDARYGARAPPAPGPLRTHFSNGEEKCFSTTSSFLAFFHL